MTLAGQEYWRLRPNAPRSGVVLGEAGAIADGAGKEFVFGRGRSVFRMFVVRQDNSYFGYLNLCPHFSLPLNHTPDRFMNNGMIECARHFAQFEVATGRCVSGACEGESLICVSVAINRVGQLVLE